MFEDLIPPASGQMPAPPPGMFDDLIPAESRRKALSALILC
jgi:hypothetical protein